MYDQYVHFLCVQFGGWRKVASPEDHMGTQRFRRGLPWPASHSGLYIIGLFIVQSEWETELVVSNNGFWRATMCWPLLCFCRPFICLDSNPECCRNKWALRRLATHTALLATHPPTLATQPFMCASWWKLEGGGGCWSGSVTGYVQNCKI